MPNTTVIEEFRKVLEHRIEVKENMIRSMKENKMGSKCELNALQTVIEELQYLRTIIRLMTDADKP